MTLLHYYVTENNKKHNKFLLGALAWIPLFLSDPTVEEAHSSRGLSEQHVDSVCLKGIVCAEHSHGDSKLFRLCCRYFEHLSGVVQRCWHIFAY